MSKLSLLNVLKIQMQLDTEFKDIGSILNALHIAMHDFKKLNDVIGWLKEVDIEYEDIINRDDYNIYKDYITWAKKRLSVMSDRKPCNRIKCFRYDEHCVYNCECWQCDCKFVDKDLLNRRWSR